MWKLSFSLLVVLAGMQVGYKNTEKWAEKTVSHEKAP